MLGLHKLLEFRSQPGRGRARGRAVLVSAALGSILVVTGVSPALGQAVGTSGLNANQESMYLAIRDPANPAQSLCPRLGAKPDRTRDEEALFVRCGRIVFATDAGQQSDALQQVTAEELNAATTNSIDFSRAQRSSIAGRLIALRGGFGGATVASNWGTGGLLTESTGGASGDEEGSGRLGFFVNGAYGSGDKDLTDYEAAYDFDLQGVTAGLDFRFTDSFVAGAAIGYSESSADYDGGGSLDSDGVAGSLFASLYGDKYYLDLIVGYGSPDFESARHVSYTVTRTGVNAGTDNIDHTAQGSTSGDTFSAGLSAGYGFGDGALRWGPAIAVSYVKAEVDGYAETSTCDPVDPNCHQELNLLYGDQSAESLQFQLGLEISYVESTPWGVASPYARVFYVAETESDRDSFYLWYVSDPFRTAATQANVVSDEPDTTFWVWNVGMSTAFANGFSGFIDYESVADLDTISYGEVTLGMRYEFR